MQTPPEIFAAARAALALPEPADVGRWDENFAEQAQRLGVQAEHHAQMAVEAKRDGRVHEVEACALRATACNQALLKLKAFIATFAG